MCNEGPSADCKTDPFPYLWNSAHACHWAVCAPAATTVVNSVYLAAISLLCPCTLLTLETISSFQLGCLLWGEVRGKAQRQTPLEKMGGREMMFLQLSTHLLNTSTSYKRIFFPLLCVCDPPAFLSLGAPLKSFWRGVCDSLSPSDSSELFAVSFLSSSLTILPTQQACFGLIFSLLLACFNLLLPWGPQASAYC